MNSKTQGSYEGWDEVWKGEKSKDQLNPHFTKAKPKTIYQFWQKAYAHDLLNLINGKGYKTFCELGSGRGTTSMYLSDAGYNDITMVDLAENGFKVAQKSFAYYNLKSPHYLLADVENTGLPSESFDCIYNIGLLEHFEIPDKTLAEAYRLLKPGGMIFMPIVPKLPYWKSAIARILFNPISLLKQIIKQIIGYQTKDNSNIFRNELDKNYYVKASQKIGYNNVRCISYNPYWKINNDGFIEDQLTLPTYLKHYHLVNKNKNISLHTGNLTEACYLLIAYK
jgi:ubiquinone/menaquinone biosynthesis C-methylase UbiE